MCGDDLCVVPSRGCAAATGSHFATVFIFDQIANSLACSLTTMLAAKKHTRARVTSSGSGATHGTATLTKHF